MIWDFHRFRVVLALPVGLGLAACAPPPQAEAGLLARAGNALPPALLPATAFATPSASQAEALGAALAARAAALRNRAAGL